MNDYSLNSCVVDAVNKLTPKDNDAASVESVEFKQRLKVRVLRQELKRIKRYF